LAEALRKLRAESGEPTFRTMAKRIEKTPLRSKSQSLLSATAKGHRLPTEDAIKAFAKACGATDEETATLLRERERARLELDKLLPAPSTSQSPHHLRQALADLALEHIPQTGTAHFSEAAANRLRRASGKKLEGIWTVTALPAERIAKELGGNAPLTEEMIGNVVFACGGLVETIECWRLAWKQLDRTAPVPTPRSWDRRRVLRAGLTAAAIGVIAGAPAIAYALTDPPAPRGTLRPISGPRSPRRPTPKDHLLALRDHVRGLDEPPSSGRFTYTRIAVWSWEDPPGDPTRAETSHYERLWWDEELSGVRMVVSTSDGRPTTTRQTFRRGEAPITIPVPSADPVELTRQLRGEFPPTAGPAGILRAIAAVYSCHALSPAQRAATHGVLAQTDGLLYEGTFPGNQLTIYTETGGEGRPVAHDLLVFDTTDGALLRYDMVTVRGRGGHAGREQTSRMDFLERRRTDTVG
jgi:hypothetical protein